MISRRLPVAIERRTAATEFDLSAPKAGCTPVDLHLASDIARDALNGDSQRRDPDFERAVKAAPAGGGSSMQAVRCLEDESRHPINGASNYVGEPRVLAGRVTNTYTRSNRK